MVVQLIVMLQITGKCRVSCWKGLVMNPDINALLFR